MGYILGLKSDLMSLVTLFVANFVHQLVAGLAEYHRLEMLAVIAVNHQSALRALYRGFYVREFATITHGGWKTHFEFGIHLKFLKVI